MAKMILILILVTIGLIHALHVYSTDITSDIQIGLPFNSQIIPINGIRNEAPANYIWGASDDGVNLLPGTAAWHEKYTPWQRENNGGGGQTLSWYQTNHPDWLMYGPDKTTLAGYGYNTYIDHTNVVLDYANPTVQQYIANILIYWLGHGYNGISIDNGVIDNNTNAAGHYTLSGVWVNQYSGTEPNDSSFTIASNNALVAITTLIHKQYPTASITVNNPYNCSWDTQSAYELQMPSVTMMVDESEYQLWDNNNSCTQASGTMWLTTANEYVHIQRDLGKGLFLINGAQPSPITPYETDTNMQVRANVQWTLANYLLIKYAHTYYWFGSYSQYGDAIPMQHEYLAAIGTPTNDFYNSQNIYMRDYTNGLVLVNPDSTNAYSVTLPLGYTDLYGNLATTIITMKAHSGMILLRTQSPSTATTTVTGTATSTTTPTSTATGTATNTAVPPTNTSSPTPTSTSTPVPVTRLNVISAGLKSRPSHGSYTICTIKFGDIVQKITKHHLWVQVIVQTGNCFSDTGWLVSSSLLTK